MRIYWYCPLKLFDAFEEMSDNPSFRLRCLNTHKYLLRNGYSSKIVHSVFEIKDPDIVILMSFGQKEFELAKWVKNRGACLIHDYSENIAEIPILEATKELCDKIVCCSTVLYGYERYTYPDKACLVKDPVENPKVVHNPNFSNEKLKVAWLGMGGNADWIRELLKPTVDSLDMEYVEISNREEADIPWNRDTWQADLASCDIALCPQAHWQFPAKSNVKVTAAIAAGLPVVASPIQSYTEIITSGVNGYICEDIHQWKDSLNKLKSKELRELFVRRTKDFLTFYSEEFIYREWEAVFKACLGSKK